MFRAAGCTPSTAGRDARRYTLALATLLCVAITTASRACGPNFPNNLLDGGDAALLVAPLSSFSDELERMNLVRTRFAARPPTDSHAQQSLETELTDLRDALRRAKVAESDVERIGATHRVQREKLRDYVAALETWRDSGAWIWDENGGRRGAPASPAPRFPIVEYAEGLPAEFADYLEGFSAWHNPLLMDKGMAREAWERLFARPAAERRFKSTWAAYMLGRSWEEHDAGKASEYFQQTRELARKGFGDSLGLAAASLGREARVHFKRGEFAPALRLYLEQHATGDPTAVNSLRLVCAAALGDPDALRWLAADELTQRVITAYLVSWRSAAGWINPRERLGDFNEKTAGWLHAVESVGVNDVEAAEKLALAAYQAGAFDVAQRWINRAKTTPLTQWLQAKLLLRAGKVNEAAALLTKITRQFPLAARGTNTPTHFMDTLWVNTSGGWSITIGRQALGELGALRLARREYTEALDALLRSGFWMDAAYVAESVLTTDELKRYVDRAWPLTAAENKDLANDADRRIAPPNLRVDIRYLLGRRLTRESRGHEASEYLPADMQADHAAFLQALDTGWDETRPADERARALFEAGRLARFRGMELLGTELAPDWHINGGGFDCGLTTTERLLGQTDNVVAASEDELQRAARHEADPHRRFHYRYQAAFLAWEAAKLMPDNSDETARVLCHAGSWIKYLDPPTADIFYKALVRRCRQTILGDQADRMRWFPVLDENGHPKPFTKATAAPDQN